MTGSTRRARLRAPLIGLIVVLAACGGGETATPTSSTTTDGPVTTETSPIIDETPAPPTGLTVVSTADGTIELVWEPSRSEAVTGYEITRVGRSITERFAVDDTGYLDSGLADGDVYTYSVAAVGPGGTSARSDSVTARVGIDENPPSVPGRPRVVDSDDATVVLEWSESADISGVATYVVQRTIDGVIEELMSESPQLLDDVEAGLVASYAVAAVDTNGNRSELSRSVTLLTGSASDRLVIVVSGTPDPGADADTARLRDLLFDAGYVVTWFDDRAFDSNLTSPGDLVVLLGDVEADGFDWNVFSTDSDIVGLKSMFMEASGLTENPPKLDRLAQLDYVPPGGDPREVVITTTGRPKPVVYIPENEQLPDLEVWARPVWSESIAVAGLIPEGGELATGRPAAGCRAFFPGNTDSLAEQTDDGWALLIEFVVAVDAACA